ncbi:MAG: MBL fold metallo-hydrolase [Chlorobi bacterium]|nr:MBL fold metallo-hydrolase [Chlorobiota bacterium]
MKIGKYELFALNTGTFGLDGGAMFGIIPKPLWEKKIPADEMNRITLGGRCLLMKSEDKIILVDTGIGNNWDEKFKKIYRVEFESASLNSSLKMKGIKPEDITDVILTHLHFDHTGGSVIFENGKMIPAFPNAKYHVQKKHFEWAEQASPKDRGSFVKNRFVPLRDEGVIQLHEGNSEFDENINLLITNGHTVNQQLVKISDGNQTLLYCADFLPTSAHVPIPYVMSYDLLPLQTIKEKEKILPQAVDEEWLLFFEHDPKIAAAKIIMNEKGFAVKETFSDLI